MHHELVVAIRRVYVAPYIYVKPSDTIDNISFKCQTFDDIGGNLYGGVTGSTLVPGCVETVDFRAI